MLARPPVLPREPTLGRKCVLLGSVGDYDHHSQIFCERDVLEQQRPWCLPFSKKNRSRAVQLINVCALLVASGSINLDVHLSSCHVRDVLRYFRARALMLVCVDYNSVSRAVRLPVLFCDQIGRQHDVCKSVLRLSESKMSQNHPATLFYADRSDTQVQGQ